jgi:hypothetical protein
MWDFSFSKAIGMVISTLPFVLLRMLAYFGVRFAYLMTVGAKATGWVPGPKLPASGATT